jgi:alkylated DNA repair dioxygenase AlkB
MNETTTWLAADPVVERVDLADRSWVDVVRGLVPAADDVHDALMETVAWEQNKVFRYERWIDEPRLGAAQKGDDRHPALREAQTWLMRRYRISLPASVPLALYRNERDGVGFHRDRELRWLEDTVIGVLTLGAQRSWLMKPLGRSGQRTFGDDEDMSNVIDLAPASGDLLVMGGRCQAAWLHAVPQTPGRCRSRISAQWRWTSRTGRRDPNPGYYAPRRFGRS